MLKQRILATLKFFDLQNLPLTLLELHRFLMAPPGELAPYFDDNWEIHQSLPAVTLVSLDELLNCLDNECIAEIGQFKGYYFLIGRQELVDLRLQNYFFGIKRERYISRWLWFVKYLPFVRGASLGGSQALGQQKPTSDIDLFIITQAEFLWIPRTLVTLYFQILGKRRHGLKVANRFCLNHYLAGIREVSEERDPYNAMEYLRLRPAVYPENVEQFLLLNWSWIKNFFPNAIIKRQTAEQPSGIQTFFEKILNNRFGLWLERFLGNWQLGRIRRGNYIIAEAGEISFHSKPRKTALLASFFKS